MIDVVVIGGGVVGLSCALEALQRGFSCAVLERHARFGEETSTHNSGVIHGGLYYPNGSLRARMCVEGRRSLVQRLENWGVPYRIGGKIILAMDGSQIGALERLYENALGNGVEGLRLVEPAEVLKREPHAARKPALVSSVTGVIDVGAYLRALEARVLDLGGIAFADADVSAVERGADVLTVMTRERGAIPCRYLVNSAGLNADRVARLCGDDRHTVYPCRGEYAVVVPRKAQLVNSLIYPVPAKLGLGVHLTRTVDGELWLGPDARYIDDKSDYENNRRPAEDFFAEANALCPAIERDDLRLGPSGIRPKRYGPGEAQPDFFIERQPDEPRVLHLVGIESPGLTASPAIARYVVDLIVESDA